MPGMTHVVDVRTLLLGSRISARLVGVSKQGVALVEDVTPPPPLLPTSKPPTGKKSECDVA